MTYALVIEDVLFTGPITLADGTVEIRTRLDARNHIDELLYGPDVSDIDDVETLVATWGTTPEAEAAQNSDFWERGL